jgi:hypothetical protein
MKKTPATNPIREMDWDSYLPDGSSNLSRPTTKNSFRAAAFMNPSPQAPASPP